MPAESRSNVGGVTFRALVLSETCAKKQAHRGRRTVPRHKKYQQDFGGQVCVQKKGWVNKCGGEKEYTIIAKSIIVTCNIRIGVNCRVSI